MHTQLEAQAWEVLDFVVRLEAERHADNEALCKAALGTLAAGGFAQDAADTPCGLGRLLRQRLVVPIGDLPPIEFEQA